MPLFLVKGTVIIAEYMNDETEKVNEIRLVEAENEKEAEAKFEKHYSDKTKEYSTYYQCYYSEASAVIQ